MSRSFRPAFLTALAIASAGGSALAQPAAPSPREACRASAISLCPAEAAAHDRPAVQACLMRNWDKVAPDCKAAIQAAHDRKSKP